VVKEKKKKTERKRESVEGETKIHKTKKKGKRKGGEKRGEVKFQKSGKGGTTKKRERRKSQNQGKREKKKYKGENCSTEGSDVFGWEIKGNKQAGKSKKRGGSE